MQTTLALFRIVIWIVDPKFDDYNEFYVYPLQQTHRMSPQDIVVTLFSSNNNSEMCMPVALFKRLQPPGINILSLLEGAYSRASDDQSPQATYDALRNDCNAIWDFPEPAFSRWLSLRSGNLLAAQNPTNRYGARFVSIKGTKPWVGGEVWLLPTLQMNHYWFRVASPRSLILGQGLYFHRSYSSSEFFQPILQDQLDLIPLGIRNDPDVKLQVLLEELQKAIANMDRSISASASMHSPPNSSQAGSVQNITAAP